MGEISIEDILYMVNEEGKEVSIKAGQLIIEEGSADNEKEV